MASKSLSRGLQTLRSSMGTSRDPLTQCLAPALTRSMATETTFQSGISRNTEQTFDSSASATSPFASDVLTTIYNFPTMEPLRFESYPANHLHLPLRKDILHRAVVFEGDATRQGTASTKTRWEIHGSHRKIRPQKGSGMARLGTKQSPMLKGGAKVFGPRPRDFSTDLPRKMYDLAWRTALSYRYRRGQLIICEDGFDIEYARASYLKKVFAHNGFGSAEGRSLVITTGERENLFWAFEHAGEEGAALLDVEVDVKDLLEMGRVIIEKSALDNLLRDHQSDLIAKPKSAA
ncbi:hypothetical protein V497_02678 [Pseudogymnoascus sp. VKM F-4516 (FW-969)]|nr:hypothetical protein V497_02678 [Pseudogymnoascus sp. VKM F-4516 (FW-969)]